MFQQAGFINMARSHSPSPERIPSRWDAGEGPRQPDAQASEHGWSLERVISASPSKVKQRAQTVCSKDNPVSVNISEVVNGKLTPATSEYLPHRDRSSGSQWPPPTARRIWRPTPIPDPHLRRNGKTWKWVGWNWSDTSKQFCPI